MTLQLKAVAKRLGSFELPPLSLTVEMGDYFVLLGPSGVGKTVLLEIIAGLLQPDSGEIIWQGKDITNSPTEARGFAIVYQDYALFPHLNVRQNIAFGLRSKRISANDIQARVASIAEKTKITELLDRCPTTLSGGEQQRVSLARALAVEPQVLLLDEPLSAVDLQIRRVLRKELKSLHKSMDTTFIHITHDVDEALQLGQSICVMLDGAIRQIGTPEELFQRPSDAAVSEFLGIANILPVSSTDQKTCLVQGHSIYLGSHNGMVRYIWIRPEEILISAHPFESSARNQIHCQVSGWELHDVLVAVRVSSGSLELVAMITYSSFLEMGISIGDELYATFKSSSIFAF